MPLGVVARCGFVAVGEVPGAAFGECRALGVGEQLAVAGQEHGFGALQGPVFPDFAPEVAQLRRIAPVEDGGAAAGAFDAVFSDFLAEVEHEGGRVEEQGAGERGEAAAGAAEEFGGGEALLVVVFEEVEDAGLQAAEPLPVPGDAAGAGVVAADGAQGVVEAGFVVEEVEADIFEVGAVVFLFVDFGDEDQVRVFGFYGRNERLQGFRGDQLHHVAAEAVYAAGGPETQDPEHFRAGLGGGPVVFAGVGPVAVAPVEAADGAFVVGGDVVGDVVDQQAESRDVGALDEGVEFFHAAGGVGGEVGVDVVPVGDGVGGAGVAFDEGFAGRMARDAGVPDVVNAQRLEVREFRTVPVRHLPVAPQPRQRLINDLLGHTANIQQNLQ